MKGRVVVVDDQESVRALVRAALEAPADDPRFEVVAETGDPTAALDLVTSVQPDAVVLDLGMPEPDDGLAAIGRLRAAHPDLPIVVHSELIDLRLMALAFGADDFVAKTEPHDALARSLDAAIAHDPVARFGAAEQAYRFLEALPVGVVVLEEGRLAFINAEARRILGTGPHDTLAAGHIPSHFHIVRESTGERYPPEELPVIRAFTKGETSSADDAIIRREDGDVPVESFATPVEGPRGPRQYAVAAFTDVTERRAQQAELARALASLSAANEALMEFAAVAAHDLAAPLRTVSGFAQMLDERHGGELSDDAITWVGLIRTEADRMQAFIEELLAYARAGAPTEGFGECSLEAVARQVCAELEPEIERAGATITIGELPVLPGDPLRLTQLLHNLLTNALKFRADGVPLKVSIEAEAVGDDWVVTVRDNGVGIADDELETVFTAFARGSAGDVQPGHGLGLSICRRIVERHGGRIWVEPAPERGSCFRFALPMATTADPSPTDAR